MVGFGFGFGFGFGVQLCCATCVEMILLHSGGITDNACVREDLLLKSPRYCYLVGNCCYCYLFFLNSGFYHFGECMQAEMQLRFLWSNFCFDVFLNSLIAAQAASPGKGTLSQVPK